MLLFSNRGVSDAGDEKVVHQTKEREQKATLEQSRSSRAEGSFEKQNAGG
jgi:hypothetical protein